MGTKTISMESMDKNKLSAWLKFASGFSKAKQEEQVKLPFHMNLIDQLHINENAHSRIMMCLLSYKNEEGKYVFLTSLIDLIKKEKQKEDYENISVVSPRISQEKERIDLWIMDKDYAIIFENKIYNAADQEAQLSRYIVKTINHGYNEHHIYIVYLSQYPKEPEQQSWGEYKDSFRSRYVNLSYCYDILPWLKDNVLRSIKREEPFLQTAIIQYIDYLEGLFKIRNIDKPMNMELNRLIEQHFNLTGKSAKDRIRIIQKPAQELDDLSSQMKALLESYRQNIYETWKKKTKENYSGLNPNKKSEAAAGWPITDVTFDDIDGKLAVVYIGCDGTQFYSGFYFDFNQSDEDRKLQGPTVEKLKKHLSQTNDINQMFESFDNDQFDEVYQHFEETIAIVKGNDN